LNEAQLPLRRLPRAELPPDTVALARYLIGKTLVRELEGERLAGRIVETEAYPIGDPAAHAYIGETKRNGSLFRALGTAYIYLGYGVSWLANVASEPEGVGAGVLLRAVEPVEGEAIMRLRRQRERPRELTGGPGRLCAAMAIDRSLDGVDLCAPGPLWLADAVRAAGEIGVSVRIGITKAADAPLRFFEKGNPYLSGGKRLNS
jgi:DNA-3-methyladenine glycosylase